MSGGVWQTLRYKTGRETGWRGKGVPYRERRTKERLEKERKGDSGRVNLQALVYDILPSTTAVFSYAIGSRKLSANEQFFVVVVGAQTVVRLLQTTQIISRVCFITDHIAYAISNKTKTV